MSLSPSRSLTNAIRPFAPGNAACAGEGAAAATLAMHATHSTPLLSISELLFDERLPAVDRTGDATARELVAVSPRRAGPLSRLRVSSRRCPTARHGLWSAR